MKKLWLLVVSITVTVIPSSAAMNFYRAANGQIVLEATDCQSAMHLINLAGVPDDPPGGAVAEDPQEEDTPAEQAKEPAPAAVPADVVQGGKKMVDAILEEETYIPTRKQHFRDISEEDEKLTAALDFDDRQEAFSTYVRDVNWKTGMKFTWRDFSFFRRLKMACSGIAQLTKPIRLNLEACVGDLDQTIENAADKGIDRLAQAARGHSFNAMSRLSLVGIADVIEKDNPFLLLAIDADTYHKLVEEDEKIGELFEDMYTFFKIRSVRMDPSYDANTKELIRVAKIGKGDSYGTWHVLSEYAKKMLALDREGKLTPNEEKEIHIWKLESAMHYIKEQVRVERRAAEMLAQDPQQAQVLQEMKQEVKKHPSLDDKARELISKSSEREIKHLLKKYIVK